MDGVIMSAACHRVIMSPHHLCIAQDNQKDFGKEYKEKVRQYEVEAATDYRLNYRLAKV